MKHRAYLYIAIAFIILAVGVAGWFFFYPLSTAEGERFIYIDADDNADSLYAKMDSISRPWQLIAFKTIARHVSGESKTSDGLGIFSTGRYAINPGETPITIFRRLKSGAQSPVNITIPEVRTMERLAAALSKKIMVDSIDIISALKDSALCASIGYDTATIYAIFIPNTYSVYWDISMPRLIDRMVTEHARFWNVARTAKAAEAGLSLTEVSTLASIVDEETANNAEKPTIAGLYINRLRIGMPLQADPTVKFATGDFTLRRITGKHLKTDSPYNTYLHEGLPPGPIRIASIAGIDAVLNYEKHDYLYMCAKEDFSGTHNFAASYGEHQRNARRYTNALNKLRIK